MDQEIRDLLKKNLELSEDNKVTLDRILRFQRIGQTFSILKWAVIILSAVGAFYYLQPMIDNLWGTYNEMIESLGTVDIQQY